MITAISVRPQSSGNLTLGDLVDLVELAASMGIFRPTSPVEVDGVDKSITIQAAFTRPDPEVVV